MEHFIRQETIGISYLRNKLSTTGKYNLRAVLNLTMNDTKGVLYSPKTFKNEGRPHWSLSCSQKGTT